MYELTVESSFSAAHQLRHYQGECERLHGHNWKVEVSIRSEELDSLGMVVDFKELKGLINEILKELDHHYLNELPAFKEANPTTENIAEFLYGEIKSAMKKKGISLQRVKIWENEGSAVSFT
ncbi:MAG: 6-carboxytetrahydropterin synthase QueD [Nitrospirae bacterium]|nr:6-carboxytetrahydropterin synthase QueD [Nitrospirota bacterium]